MIGFSYLYETEGWLHHVEPTHALRDFCEAERITFDQYDFNTNTFQDLVDYMEFQEFEHYVFVLKGSGERVLRLVAYLQQKMLSVQFHLVREDGEVLFGDPRFLYGLDLPLSDDDVETAEPIELQNAIMSLFTGVHPDYRKRHPQPLRHVYVEDTSLLETVSPLFEEMTINSLLYVDVPVIHDMAVIDVMSRTPVLIAFAEAAEGVKQVLSRTSRVELREDFKRFIATGVVRSDRQAQGMFDYATAAGLPATHRLFFFRDGVFGDHGKTMRLSDTVLDATQLQDRQLGRIEPLDALPLLSLYPLLYQLASAFSSESSFITAYSRAALPPLEHPLGPCMMIGIENGEGCFVFELATNRLFETNKTFLLILEADQKERFDTLPELLGETYESDIQTYKEMIYHG
ncbi:hypothetical protein [Exiguobacterium flavidum]|uniref:hypothetical protein n=1 Tax=Exiguobacterium flavidum TaxID=2184695 RepID=UPI000DF79B76|nr:hypothetical protein [Exiguobacterium flavidum]